MSYIPNSSFTSLVTTDSQLIATGKLVRVYNIHIISGGTAAVVSFVNGGATGTGTVYLKLTGTANTGATFTFGSEGIKFPSGLYIDVDTNTTSVAVTYNVLS